MSIQWEEVESQMAGSWRDFFGQLLGESVVNGKHQACPSCGGKDRFRFKDTDQDGKSCGFYFCSQCGEGNAFSLYEKTHQGNFNDFCNEIGRYLNIIPESKLIKRRKIAKVGELTPDIQGKRQETYTYQELMQNVFSRAKVVVKDGVHHYFDEQCNPLLFVTNLHGEPVTCAVIKHDKEYQLKPHWYKQNFIRGGVILLTQPNANEVFITTDYKLSIRLAAQGLSIICCIDKFNLRYVYPKATKIWETVHCILLNEDEIIMIDAQLEYYYNKNMEIVTL